MTKDAKGRRVDEFPEIWGLLTRAYQRNHIKLKPSQIGKRAFDGIAGAQQMSAYTSGGRPFYEDRLQLVLREIGANVGILEKFNYEMWFAGARAVAVEMVRIGILADEDCIDVDAPLFDRLARLKDANALRSLLGEHKTTHTTMNVFEANVRQLGELGRDKVARFEELLREVIEQGMEGSDPGGLVARALEVLARMGKIGWTSDGLRLPLMEKIKALPVGYMPRFHPAALINFRHRDRGELRAVLLRVIKEPELQIKDGLDHEDYYDGLVPMLDRTALNMQTRPFEERMTDIGRAIVGVAKAMKHPDTVAVGMRCRAVVLNETKSLKEVGLSHLRNDLERQMPAYSSKGAGK